MSLPSRESGIGHELTIGFVRRGYSSGGGAEAYLKRVGAGIAAAGHRALLFTGPEWPADEWGFGEIRRVGWNSATAFADELKTMNRGADTVLYSLERVWECDVYRAGDGVHAAWLKRRDEFAGPVQRLARHFNRKHSATLALEGSLFGGGAKRVIANSKMVKEEITRHYGYPADRIDVVYNGVPIVRVGPGGEDRAQTRARMGLGDDDVAVLFAGSGWERKGLRFAIEAVERQQKRVRFLVAGRGESRTFRSSRTQFLGVVREMASLYRAADIFLLPTLYDPFSNACLEALAAGKPVITTRANGFSEIVENERHASILESPADVDGISRALQFWSDPAERSRAKMDNIALAAQFDISRNVAQTLEVLAKARL